MSQLPSLYQQHIHAMTYSRWVEEQGRRELWPETVDRYVTFMDELTDGKIPSARIRDAVLQLDVFGSMRCMMTAGKALQQDNAAGYNCSYLSVDRVQAFDEAMYLLMCGVGVGYSVEERYVSQLPKVPGGFREEDVPTIVVPDSKIGWSTAFRQVVSSLYSGVIPRWDLSRIRPAGEPLRTFGGRASGPRPLDELFRYTVGVFRKAIGRKLTDEEAHAIMCKVGDIVVVGGVRRSAMICLSDLHSARMRTAKSGDWADQNPHYRLANISAVYERRPDADEFLKEWKALVRSGSGERGIFNREAAREQLRRHGRRDPEHEFGLNPCGEIVLRNRQFCNLSQWNIRSGDQMEDLAKKVELATILGTAQSLLTDFRYLSPAWKRNTEEERLLGVAPSGVMDRAGLDRSQLEELRKLAIATNVKWAKKLDITPSVAVTTVKPSGNSSQLADTASGLHRRYAPFYVRRVRANKVDPVAQFMVAQGVPVEDEVFQPETTWVFSYPQRAPDDAATAADLDVTAVAQLDTWRLFKRSWCEHNASATIYVRPDEWIEVAAYVYRHFDDMLGVTFLPAADDHKYVQAPYEEITEEEYHEMLKQLPAVDWSQLDESADMTEGSQELACVAGSCEV